MLSAVINFYEAFFGFVLILCSQHASAMGEKPTQLLSLASTVSSAEVCSRSLTRGFLLSSSSRAGLQKEWLRVDVHLLISEAKLKGSSPHLHCSHTYCQQMVLLQQATEDPGDSIGMTGVYFKIKIKIKDLLAVSGHRRQQKAK